MQAALYRRKHPSIIQENTREAPCNIYLVCNVCFRSRSLHVENTERARVRKRGIRRQRIVVKQSLKIPGVDLLCPQPMDLVKSL